MPVSSSTLLRALRRAASKVRARCGVRPCSRSFQRSATLRARHDLGLRGKCSRTSSTISRLVTHVVHGHDDDTRAVSAPATQQVKPCRITVVDREAELAQALDGLGVVVQHGRLQAAGVQQAAHRPAWRPLPAIRMGAAAAGARQAACPAPPCGGVVQRSARVSSSGVTASEMATAATRPSSASRSARRSPPRAGTPQSQTRRPGRAGSRRPAARPLAASWREPSAPAPGSAHQQRHQCRPALRPAGRGHGICVQPMPTAMKKRPSSRPLEGFQVGHSSRRYRLGPAAPARKGAERQ